MVTRQTSTRQASTRQASKKRGIWARVRSALHRDVTRSDRGVALLIALTAIAVMSSFSIEFAYNMRVSVYQSTNLKREVQAYYHARSAMEISRAVIFAQKQFQSMLGALGGGKMGNLELWRYACTFAQIFATGKVEFMGKTLFSLKDYDGVGVTKGGFECQIEPEDGRVNISRVSNAKEKTALFRKVYALLRRYFGIESMDTRDRDAVELVLNIIDWVDADENRSDIDEAGNVVDTGGAGEDRNYGRYGYEMHNAKPDSNEELRLIDGMTDDLFCDIGSKLTIYDTDKVNVNTADIEVIKALVCEYVQGDMRAVCGVGGAGMSGMGGLGVGFATPVDYVGELIDTCRRIKSSLMMPAFKNPQEFASIFQKLPEPLNALVRVNAKQMQAAVSTKARVLRIRTTGFSGPIRKTLEAVIDTSGDTFVYWREI